MNKFVKDGKLALALLLAALLVVSLSACNERVAKDEAETEPTAAVATPEPSPTPTPDPVELGGKSFAWDTRELPLDGAEVSAQELATALRQLPAAELADLGEMEYTQEDALSLAAEFPAVEFKWTVDLFGVKASSFDEYICLDGVEIGSAEAVERLMPLLFRTKQIDMCGCGIDDEAMYELNERWPNTRMVWLAHLGTVEWRTDKTYFCRNKVYGGPSINDEYLDVQLKYFPDMIALDVGHGKHSITRCDWLQYAPQMQYLVIAIAQIEDISVLSQLTELKYLEVFSNEGITDISSLAGLDKLVALNLSNLPGITDLTPLYGLKNLQYCWLNMDPQLTDEQVAALQEQLPDCLIRHTTWGCTAQEWRRVEPYYEMRDALHAKYIASNPRW